MMASRRQETMKRPGDHPVATLVRVQAVDRPHLLVVGLRSGGGVEMQAYHHVWIRADYQYQMWHEVFGPYTSNPNGFTIGGQWDFRRSHSH